MFELVSGALKIKLCLLKLADISSRDVVAAHLHRRLDLRIQIDDLRLQTLFVLSQKFFGGHDLGHGIIQVRNTIAHVANRLLQDQLGILG